MSRTITERKLTAIDEKERLIQWLEEQKVPSNTSYEDIEDMVDDLQSDIKNLEDEISNEIYPNFV